MFYGNKDIGPLCSLLLPRLFCLKTIYRTHDTKYTKAPRKAGFVRFIRASRAFSL